MKDKYTIKELKDLPIQIKVYSKEEANNLAKKHGYKKDWFPHQANYPIYIKCHNDYNCPTWSADDEYLQRNYDVTKTIEFSQIDFQENILDTFQIW